MARQLSFDLPAKTALGREDFFVSPANALAVAMISANVLARQKTGAERSVRAQEKHIWPMSGPPKQAGA